MVRALDITHDPANGMDISKLADALVASRDPRILYIICNGGIISSVVKPWEWRKYTGSNPHDKHIHISVVGDVRLFDDNDPWNLSALAQQPEAPTPRPTPRPTPPTSSPAGPIGGVIATTAVTVGLGGVIWNYLGWIGLAAVVVLVGFLVFTYLRSKRPTPKPQLSGAKSFLGKDTPIIDGLVEGVKRRRPILGGLIDLFQRAGSALFDKAETIVLPPSKDPTTGATIPGATINTPAGLLRDPSNITIVLMIVYWITQLAGWSLPFTSDQVAEFGQSLDPSDGYVTMIMGAIASIFRSKSKNLTRG